MPRVVHFEIPAEDPQRAAAFYKKAFGWKIEKWPGPMDYWMVTTGPDGTPGINGGLMKKGDVSATTNTVDVESVEKAIAAVTGAAARRSCRRRRFPRLATSLIARIQKEICSA